MKCGYEYLARKRRWRLANPEKVKAIKRRHRATHLESVRAGNRVRNKRWQLKNPHKLRAQCVLRRARQRKVTIGDLTAIENIYHRARWWRQWFDAVVDHIIPLAKNGTHEASNLQIIYGFENKRKGDRLNYKPRVVFV